MRCGIYIGVGLLSSIAIVEYTIRLEAGMENSSNQSVSAALGNHVSSQSAPSGCMHACSACSVP